MSPTAYIETSIVSYLTSRPSRDVVITAHQQVTREWWRTAGDRFHLAASELVIREAGQGDPDAARARLMALEDVTLLDATEEAEELAHELIASRAVSPTAAVDAAHIAIAVTNRVHYLVTWNFRQLPMRPCGPGSSGCVGARGTNRPSSALLTS